MKQIVYFAGAIRGNRDRANIFPHLMAHIKGLGVTVLSEHLGANDPSAALAKHLDVNVSSLTPSLIESTDMGWLDQATHVIAEVSGSSTGVGREIEYARTKGDLGKTPARVLCLYDHKDAELVSAMILGMDQERYSNVLVRGYDGEGDAERLIEEFLKEE